MEASGRNTLALGGYIFVFLAISSCILLTIDEKQPGPYMDEIFHIPQAQKYCAGNFTEWDPMITTLPGLYLSSIGILKPVSSVLRVSLIDICKTFWLRSLNIAFAVGNVYLLSQLAISTRILPGDAYEVDDAPRRLGTAVALSLFPVLYFFSFLYYTDSGSTFCVLLMYLLSLHENHLLAAFIGLISVGFRQTNIVWVLFVTALALCTELIEYVKPEKKDLHNEMQNMPFVLTLVKLIWKGLKNNSKSVRMLMWNCVKVTWPYALVGVAFISFVGANGGIVVGAKNDHQASLHFPQVFYFITFTTVFSCMHLITLPKLHRFFKFLFRHPVIVMLFCFVSAILVWKFTITHRYLLADNRHYTFYIWARLYKKHYLVKYFLIPTYFYGIWSIVDSIRDRSILWKISFILCTAVNLVPQMLVEFRYFILPYLILRVNMRIPSYLQLLLEIALYTVVNTAIIYIFLQWTFVWKDSDDLQRFMW